MRWQYDEDNPPPGGVEPEPNNFDNSPVGGFFGTPSVGDGTGRGTIVDAMGRVPGDVGFDANTAHFAATPSGAGGFGGAPGGVGGPAAGPASSAAPAATPAGQVAPSVPLASSSFPGAVAPTVAMAPGISPATASLLKYLLPTVSNAISGYLQNKNSTAARNQQTGLTESLADPFRQEMDQAKDLAGLDRLGSISPTKLTFTGPYASSIPQRSGGTSWSPSPALLAAAKALQAKIASGQGAPTQTDPNNYGKTAAMNLPWS